MNVQKDKNSLPNTQRNFSKQLPYDISCVVPVFNEQEGIEAFLTALNAKLSSFNARYEIIIVDDGSFDQTCNIVKNLITTMPIKLLSLSKNFGKEIALSAGLERCSGEIAILIDSDFQHPLELLDVFIQNWKNGFDMVYGIRVNHEHEKKIRQFLSRSFYRLINLMTRVNIVPNAGDFRLLDRKVYLALNSCEERGRFMKGLYAWVGFSSIGVPFSAAKRAQGKSGWHFRSLTELAITGITLFSNIPLRMVSLCGLIVSLLSFLYSLVLSVKVFLYGIDLPGYASIMVTIMFMGGVQLLSIGILGEYIARIFNEVKLRPKYLIQEEVGFATST